MCVCESRADCQRFGETVRESCRLSESGADCQRFGETVRESCRLSEIRGDCQRLGPTVRKLGRLSESRADCQKVGNIVGQAATSYQPTLTQFIHILYPHTSIAPTYFTLPLHPPPPHCILIYFSHPHSLYCTHIFYSKPLCVGGGGGGVESVCVLSVCVSMIPTYLLSQLPDIGVGGCGCL